MKGKLSNIYLAAALLAAFIGAIAVIGLCKRSQTDLPVAIGVEDCSSTVENFCTLLEEGNYAELEDMIYGYVDLNLCAEPESEIVERLRSNLRESYRSSAASESRVSGMNAEQDIVVEYFDIELAKNDVKQYANEYYAAKMESAESNEELYDGGGELLESVAMEVFEESLDKVFSAPDSDRYRTSRTITLELIYDRGSWKIILTDELVQVLLGGVS